MTGLIAVVIIVLAIVVISWAVKLVPQSKEYVVERLGRYQRTLSPGLNVIIPIIDRVRNRVDMREQVFAIPPVPVITKDNVGIEVDVVFYYRVTSARDSTYEIAGLENAITELSVTTLRNALGTMDLEEALSSREEINTRLRAELGAATQSWGLNVTRVELKSLDPPIQVRQAMEQLLEANRSKRAEIERAEGDRDSAILRAEGQKQAAILSAEGQRESQIRLAEGEKEALRLRGEGEQAAVSLVGTAFAAQPSDEVRAALLLSRYIDVFPEIANGDANKLIIVPNDGLAGVIDASLLGEVLGRTELGDAIAARGNGTPAANAS